MAEKIVSELLERLKGDKDLAKDSEMKTMFMSYARMFDAELNDNLKLTSVELDAKYKSMNPSTWLKFLRHPIVKRYVDNFLEETAEKKAALVLSEDAGKPRDALSIQKRIEDKNKGNDNGNIIVYFMPQKRYVEFD